MPFADSKHVILISVVIEDLKNKVGAKFLILCVWNHFHFGMTGVT